MHNTCGQPVGDGRKNSGTIRARLSPHGLYTALRLLATSVQVLLSPKLSVSFTSYLSPSKMSVSPLIEHYLYPVSTVPIINPNQIN